MKYWQRMVMSCGAQDQPVNPLKGIGIGCASVSATIAMVHVDKVISSVAANICCAHTVMFHR
jgi:hypothetical protein